MRRAHFVPLILAVLAIVWAVAVDDRVRAQGPPPQAPSPQPPRAENDPSGQLRWRYIGPVGNRTTSVVGVPGEPHTYYVGAASGGVWKTIDDGTNWEPLFDAQDAQSIGSLALDPLDKNVLWAGTGEPYIRSNISQGNGVYKSVDAGRTWTHVGLDKIGRTARIVIDPRNSDVVHVCALGHGFGPQQERGVFRTTDGGKTWTRTLFVDENTGCSDLVIDPSNARILYAGTWPLEIKTYTRMSGGPGSGIFKSIDGGATWRKLTGPGLPTRETGKVALGIARTNPNRVYALIETGDGVPWKGQPTDVGKLWRTDDGGATWRMVSTDQNLGGRTAYYFRMTVAPDNENEVYFFTSGFAQTLDGGLTNQMKQGNSSPGGDNHDMWIDPDDPTRMAVVNDQGVALSVTRGRTWERFQLPIGQMYHVTTDTQVPYWVLGNRQDGPSYRGPSNSRAGGFGGFGGGIPRSVWHGVGGGESGFAIPDPTDPMTIWSNGTGLGMQGGVVEKYDVKSGYASNFEIWPESTIGAAANEVKYRFNWTMPIHISPYDHNTLYAGSQHVHVTRNGGKSWDVISPDLTLGDNSRLGKSGGLTPDNIGVEFSGVVMAITESRIEKGLIWVGTNDGQVQMTRDAGKSWTNVTKAIPNLPAWGTVYNIEPSRFDAGTAYVQFDFHQMGRFDPFIYKTADYGKTWTPISSGLPNNMLSYTHCVREDPVRRGLLYAGTESGIFISFNDGAAWQPLQANLPHAPVYWITVQEQFNDLAIATYGRGFWIMDDITPLRQLTDQVRASNVHLFTPRQAYRFRTVEGPAAPSHDATAGQNPAYGASINYWLKTPPAGDVRIQVTDSGGQAVRTLTGSKAAGVNRVVWDLRYDALPPLRLRTPPQFQPESISADGTRASPENPNLQILAAPGVYTVKLTAGGQEFTERVTVLKDPNSSGTEADITAAVALQREVQKDLQAAVAATVKLESMRSQLVTLKRLAQGDPNARAIIEAIDNLEAKLVDVEGGLVQLRVTGAGQDTFRAPVQLVGKLSYLGGGIGDGDQAPTAQAREVHAQLRKQVEGRQKDLDAAIAGDVANFNKLMQTRGLQGVTPK